VLNEKACTQAKGEKPHAATTRAVWLLTAERETTSSCLCADHHRPRGAHPTISPTFFRVPCVSAPVRSMACDEVGSLIDFMIIVCKNS
jgi:hypothetical protein